ncbi:hypothetical protein Tco_0359497 [Tanacetum coccineum]
MQKGKVDMSKALDAGLVVTESSGTKSDKHDTSSISRNDTTHVVDEDIRPVNDQEPLAEVQLTAQHNILANEQQHTEQSGPIYDTYLLEKVDSNTTPDSTNMSNNGGKTDQDAEQYHVKSPLPASLIDQPTIDQLSPNKSSTVHEKTNTPRSCLKWKPTSRIFKIVGLMWIQTGKLFASSTIKVDSEPPHSSNADISNFHKCIQTPDVSPGPELKMMTPGIINLGLMQNPPSPTPYVPPIKNDWDILFQPMFDEYFNPLKSVVSLVPTAAAPRPIDTTGTPSSTSIDQDAPFASTSPTQETQSLIISKAVEE